MMEYTCIGLACASKEIDKILDSLYIYTLYHGMPITNSEALEITKMKICDVSYLGVNSFQFFVSQEHFNHFIVFSGKLFKLVPSI